MERTRRGRRSASKGANENTNPNVFHSQHIPGAKHYKAKQDGQVYIFSGLTPKQFKEENPGKVVGYFSKKSEDGSASGFKRMFEIKRQLHGESTTVDFDVYSKHKRLHKAIAYVPIGNDEFLVYERFMAGRVFGASAVAVLAVVLGLLAFAKSPVNPLGIAPTVAIGGDGKGDVDEDAMIDFAGYTDMEVNDGNPYILLQNPETNDVYFSYVVTDSTGKEIMTTDLIPPGKALQWAAKNDLGAGEHKINMHVDTYDMEDTTIPYNAMNYDSVKVSIE